MATPHNKVLGQVAPTGTTFVNLFGAAVPAGHEYVVSTLTINARNSVTALASIRIRKGGATAANEHDWWTDVTINPGAPENLTFGLTFEATDVVEVKTSVANALTFSAFGADIS